MESERLQEVGRRIRVLRQRRGLTLRTLAEASSLSVGFLSQIERGLSSFSIPSLRAICQALDVSLAEMLVISNGPGKAFFADPRPSAITKGDNRSYVSLLDASTTYRFLSAGFPGRRFEALIGQLSPGSESEAHVHDGEEFGYVLDGQVRLRVEEATHKLGPGDSYHLLAATPHCCTVEDPPGARILWVQTARYARALALLGKNGAPIAHPLAPIRSAAPSGDGAPPQVSLSENTVAYRFLSGAFPETQLQVLVAEIPPGYRDDRRVYEGEEFGYVLEGRVLVVIDEESYRLGAGDCYHLPATTSHACHTEDASAARVLWVQMGAASDDAETAWAATETNRTGHEPSTGERKATQ